MVKLCFFFASLFMDKEEETFIDSVFLKFLEDLTSNQQGKLISALSCGSMDTL